MVLTRSSARLSINALGEDGLVAVLARLSDLRDVGRALNVCKTWSTAITHYDEIWMNVALETWPMDQHAMDMLKLSWKARCLLLTRRRIPKIPPLNEQAMALMNLSNDYAFFLSLTNHAEAAADAAEKLCAVSMQATIGHSEDAFTVEATFPVTDLGAGVFGPWLQPEPQEVDACEGFGSLMVDVYMRRLSDAKVAHFARLKLHFKDPCNDIFAFTTTDGCIAVRTEDQFCRPPWLIEQAAAMWPPLDIGFSSNGGRGYRKFLVQDHQLGPRFVPLAGLDMELPSPDEYSNDDDKAIKSGKIKSVKLEFRWESIIDSWDYHDPVTPVYVAHVLAGPCIEWV